MVQRIVLGKLADGAYGLRISKAGYDANEVPANNDHLIFNSDWGGMLQVYQSGNFLHRDGGSQAGQVVTQTVDFPALYYNGSPYIPYVEFFFAAVQNYSGNPLNYYYPIGRIFARNSARLPTAPPGTGSLGGIPFYMANTENVWNSTQAWLKCSTSTSQLRIQSYDPNTSSRFPCQYRIYYVIYRRKAN